MGGDRDERRGVGGVEGGSRGDGLLYDGIKYEASQLTTCDGSRDRCVTRERPNQTRGLESSVCVCVCVCV